MRISLGLTLVIFFFLSCDNSQTKDLIIQKMIEEDVEKRVKNFIQVREEVCQKQVLERAVLLADSIMLEEIRRMKINTTVPLVPEKPQRPEVKVDEAYEKVRPLLDSLKKSAGAKSSQALRNS